MSAPSEAEGFTRAAALDKFKVPPQTPEAPEGSLPGWIMSIGFYRDGGMGPVPLPAIEVDTWSRVTGADVSPYEFELLMEASSAFLSGYRAKEPPTPEVGFAVNSAEQAIKVRLSMQGKGAK